jgi:MFS family permease
MNKVEAVKDASTQGYKENKKEERKALIASSLGTVFEWYDFYLYGSLAVFLSAMFFPPGNVTVALLASLAALAAGFLVRPFGALFFGRLGDLIGRKYTFLITIVIMGVTTAGVGLIPTYAQIGDFAWILLLLMRLLQGLAMGGEYGGAAIYVAENSPNHKRGYMTSWIQTTATLGLLLSMVVILGCRFALSEADFKAWGWRIPFILSIILLLISVYIRSKLNESPTFIKMKAEGRSSKSPIKDSFGKWSNLKYVLLALFGVTAGMGAVWYTGQFYVLFFMQQVLKIDLETVYLILSITLILGTPMFLLTGWLSDRIGRKWIMMTGLLLGIILFRPLFMMLAYAGNPALVQATAAVPVVVYANDGDECVLHLGATLINQHPDHKKPCVQAKKFLIESGINFSYAPPREGKPISMEVGGQVIDGFDRAAYRSALTAAGYPEKADKERINKTRMVFILLAMMAIVAMIYGPVAAFLVELFPTRIRYTSLSLPYHIGAGCIGGFLPFFATYLSLSQGNIYAGLWYPITIAAISLVIGSIFLKETYRTNIHAH